MALHAYTPPLHAVKTGQPRFVGIVVAAIRIANLRRRPRTCKCFNIFNAGRSAYGVFWPFLLQKMHF